MKSNKWLAAGLVLFGVLALYFCTPFWNTLRIEQRLLQAHTLDEQLEAFDFVRTHAQNYMVLFFDKKGNKFVPRDMAGHKLVNEIEIWLKTGSRFRVHLVEPGNVGYLLIVE
jgi:hypothetical protein